MSIDPNKPTPIYQQIAAHVRRRVAAGVFRTGDAIPSTRAMALELTVNPNTVQRAYELLEREGLIAARKGLGMFVTENGVSSAKKAASQAVYDAFAGGIRAGRAAELPADAIRSTFRRAADDLLEKPGSQP